MKLRDLAKAWWVDHEAHQRTEKVGWYRRRPTPSVVVGSVPFFSGWPAVR